MTTGIGRRSFGHWLYLVTLAGKGVLGVVQLAAGAAVLLGITAQMPAITQWLVAAELAEDPSDFLASKIIALGQALQDTDTNFYAVYFLAHGVLHIGIVAALLRRHGWAYPAAIAVLAAFVVYQAVEWALGGGTTLLVLSAVDLLVIWLTLSEWRYRVSCRGHGHNHQKYK